MGCASTVLSLCCWMYAQVKPSPGGLVLIFTASLASPPSPTPSYIPAVALQVARLAVSGAFHTSLMEPAREALMQVSRTISCKK